MEEITAEYERILGGNYLPKEKRQHEIGQPNRQPSDDPEPTLDTGEEDESFEAEDTDKGKDEEGSEGRGPCPEADGSGDQTKTGACDFIPDLKKVVQFSDVEGKKHVIGLETYRFKARRPRHTEVLADAEQRPFRNYAVLFKASIQDDARGIKADFSIEIQSDSLKDIFRTIAKRHLELRLDTGDDPIVIQSPFHSLFFLRTKLRELQQAETTAEQTRRELAGLLDFIHAPVGHQGIIETYNSLVPHGKITFGMVWTLYPPYEPVIAQYPGRSPEDSSCDLVESVEFDQSASKACWRIHVLFGHHDGASFHLKRSVRTIGWFDGVKNLTKSELPLVPLSLLSAERREAVRAALVRRGQLYVDYCTRDFSFVHYTGYAYLEQKDSDMQLKAIGATDELYVDTHVIIDRTAERTVSNVKDDMGSTVASSLGEYLASTVENQISLSTSSPAVRPMSRQLRDLVQYDFGGGDDTTRGEKKTKQATTNTMRRKCLS